MSELIEQLTEKIVTPENKSKLNTFLGVLKDVVSVNGKVTVLESGNRFILSRHENTVQVTVSRDFLDNLGDFELVVDGSSPFTSNVFLSMNGPVPQPEENDRETVEFTRGYDHYKSSLGNGFLECLDDIRMVNLLKRGTLPPQTFEMVRQYLEKQGFQVVIKGDETPVDTEPGTTVVQVTGTTEPSIGQKVVIKEVPVYVDKIVIKEVPVEVQKVVIKEVPVYVDRHHPPPQEPSHEEPQEEEEPEEVVVTKSKGPIQEPSMENSASEESEFEESTESSEPEESEPEESAPEESTHEPRKLKGRWLNPQKTVLKSGDFVYRVDKKIDGPAELYALGRWDKGTQKQVSLRKGDKKIIKKLGNKIAKTK